MYKVVLFDLDGTLVDPVVGITNSIIHAFKKYNMEVKDRSELLKFIGPPLADSFQEFYGFSKEKAWEAMGFYREYYSVKGVFENTLYDGIEEMLKTLKEHGYVIGLATSKPEPFARLIIESFKLTKYFDYIAGASFDDSRHQKEQVVEYALQTLNVTNPSEALMVGDRKFDVIGARINNMDCVGVLYGYGSEEELQEANAKYIVKTPQDIINLLCK